MASATGSCLPSAATCLRRSTTCDALTDRWERRSCYGGVFMQNVMVLSGSKHLRPDDPLYPCADLADRYRAMCYEKQAGLRPVRS